MAVPLRHASFLIFGAGLLFCIAALERFTTGFALPLGIPLSFIIGWITYRQKRNLTRLMITLKTLMMVSARKELRILNNTVFSSAETALVRGSQQLFIVRPST